jgi:hypothetical protein
VNAGNHLRVSTSSTVVNTGNHLLEFKRLILTFSGFRKPEIGNCAFPDLC